MTYKTSRGPMFSGVEAPPRDDEKKVRFNVEAAISHALDFEPARDHIVQAASKIADGRIQKFAAFASNVDYIDRVGLHDKSWQRHIESAFQLAARNWWRENVGMRSDAPEWVLFHLGEKTGGSIARNPGYAMLLAGKTIAVLNDQTEEEVAKVAAREIAKLPAWALTRERSNLNGIGRVNKGWDALPHIEITYRLLNAATGRTIDVYKNVEAAIIGQQNWRQKHPELRTKLTVKSVQT